MDRSSVTLFLGMALLLLAGALLLGPTGRDDVYKTLWPAHTISEHGLIQNYNGDSVEQSSSLLHVLCLGLLHRLTAVPLPLLNHILVILPGLGAIIMFWRLAQQMVGDSGRNAVIALGAQPLLIYWSWGGQDAAIMALVWLVWVAALQNAHNRGMKGRWTWLGVGGAALMVATTRPEGWMVALLGLGISWLFASRRADRPTSARVWLVLIGVAVAVAASVTAWRVWHGGGWLPQSASAKASLWEPSRWVGGGKYLFRTVLRHPELFFPATGLIAWLILVIRREQITVGVSILLGLSFSGVAFVVLSGGDWMENGRFLVPYLPVVSLLLAAWVAKLGATWRRGILAGWVLVSLGSLFWTARTQNTGYPLWWRAEPSIVVNNATLQNWAQRDGVPVPDLRGQIASIERLNRVHLRDVTAARDLIWCTDLVYRRKESPVVVLSQQAGMMPYHLGLAMPGKFRFIDLVGLCTSDFTDCSVTRHRGNFPGGLNMDLCYLFQDWNAITQECGLPEPDIVFTLSDEAAGLDRCVTGAGYRIVSQQGGNLPQGPSWMPGLLMDAGEFIAVKEKWVGTD